MGYTTLNFTDEATLESYVRSSDYSKQTQVCFAIVVDSSTVGGSYQYKLRFNISVNPLNSDGPSTSLKLTQDKAIDITMYNTSLVKGMIGANTLVNTMIFQA